MRWLYERKFVSLPRQAKATTTASERTKTFVLQSTGASSPTGLRQTESSGSAFRVNRNQSYRGRLTTRISRILLTRQLGTVVRRETDNPNQRSTGVAYTLVDGSKMVRCSKGDGREMEGATNMAKNLLVCRILCTFAIDCGLCSFI